MKRAVVIYDGDCGLCRSTRTLVEGLDWFGTLRWVPLQSAEAGRFGIPRPEMERSVQLISGERRWSGFEAVKRIALRLPPVYAAAGMAVARKPVLALPIAFLFSPCFAPAGERLYRLVSEHRHLMPPGVCGVIS